MTWRMPEAIEDVRTRAAHGALATEIAAALGVDRTKVRRLALAHDIALPTKRQAAARRMADPVLRARIAATLRRRWDVKLGRVPLPVEVPVWVPERLREVYREVARSGGEERAASQTRRLKAALLHDAGASV